MRIVIVDGQGGGVGKSLAERLRDKGLAQDTVVVGTNAVATSNMMRAGIPAGATGENAVGYNCARAKVIAGPIGIVLSGAMHGEISPAMATAVAESPAKKILIPISNHHAQIVGLGGGALADHLDEAVDLICKALN